MNNPTIKDGTTGLRIFEPCDDPAGEGCTLFEDPANLHLAESRLVFSHTKNMSMFSFLCIGGIRHRSVFQMAVS